MWQRFLGEETEPLNFQLGIVKIPPASNISKTLRISRQGSASLIYLPSYKTTRCDVDNKEPQNTICDLVEGKNGLLLALLGKYEGELGSCQIKQIEIKGDENDSKSLECAI